tara:strand:+ start:49 stop:1758 length:1710 start_codon:yes stop_codon:yes gene_type:complete
MKFFIKKIYIVLFLGLILLSHFKVYAKDNEIQYTRKNISNYFLGIISSNQHYDNQAYKYLKKVQSLKKKHSNFNIEFIKTLVLLEKFDKAFSFSKSIWDEDELLFEADLLLGLESFLNKDYSSAKRYFKRLNKTSRHNLFFDEFIGNVLITWVEAAEGNKKDSFNFLEKVPRPYRHLVKIQNTFLHCYFDLDGNHESFKKLIQDENYNFSRYNFFLVNYLLFKNQPEQAKKLIAKNTKKNNSTLLIKQIEKLLINNDYNKIKNFFNCKNPEDVIAEFFYVLANIYSSEGDYKMSNFYLKISLFLNQKFWPNNALLAENFYYQKKYEHSKNIYFSLKKIGQVYSWYAEKNISSILLQTEGKESSVKNLENEFDSIENPNFEHYYELANFYKENELYAKSIKYYSLALDEITKDHFLFPKILDRRGTSYERLGDWKKAEKDLIKSLKILPDQPHVLNYLAYTWIDKGINLDQGLKMLKKASELRKNDGYILDSLGWAYYAKKNYSEAEKYLQKAVELMPFDPIINDHYADVLWMLEKNIQARYFWDHVLKLDTTEQKLKVLINEKLIFGIN